MQGGWDMVPPPLEMSLCEIYFIVLETTFLKEGRKHCLESTLPDARFISAMFLPLVA